MLLFSGCWNEKIDVIGKLKKKINSLNSYQISGNLEVTNNETTYQYDIQVDYEADEKYRVSLKNKTNDHEQIILKNSSGVYVLTPSLNKSFKFQSEWPYNNSQSYLYQAILNDIENDDEAFVEEKEDGYIITTTVNYSNNRELTKQKIYVDKDINITKVEVLNEKEIVKIRMTYKKVNEKPSFEKDYFELSNNLSQTSSDKEENATETTSKIDSIVYPLYIPENTKLESQDVIKTENGERIILTFAGDSPFTLIEEPVSEGNNQEVISVYGEIEFINDTIGSISGGTASWISDGIEYYAVSNTMDSAELLEVINSVNVLPVGK